MVSFLLFRSLHKSKRAFLKTLQKTFSPNRYSGLDRWIVKGVKTRIGASMSVWLYDLVSTWQADVSPRDPREYTEQQQPRAVKMTKLSLLFKVLRVY
jgi:hypothetical protein